jgi:hypothetical protein
MAGTQALSNLAQEQNCLGGVHKGTNGLPLLQAERDPTAKIAPSALEGKS